jgi:hypothetical protein
MNHSFQGWFFDFQLALQKFHPAIHFWISKFLSCPKYLETGNY